MSPLSLVETASRPPATVSLRDLLTPLFRHRWLLVCSFLLVFVAALGFLLSRPKQYEARMEILVNRERTDPLISAEATSETGIPKAPVTEEEINSEAELIHSEDLLTQVVLATHLQNDSHRGLLSRLLGKPQPTEAERVGLAVARLGLALKVKNVLKSNMFEVSYTSPDAHQTYAVLNTLGNLYIEKHIAVQRPPGAYTFFAQETQRYQDAMNSAEDRLRQFGQSGDLAAPDLQRSALAVQLGELVGQRNRAQAAVAADMDRMHSDTARLEVTSDRIRTARTSAPPTMLLQQLGGDVLHAEARRTELALKYKPDYPLVREADAELLAARNAFEKAQTTEYVSETTDNDPTHEAIRQDLARTQSDLAAQRGSLGATERSLQALRGEIGRLDAGVLEQQNLKREAKANEDNFLLYQSKREQERAADVLDRIRIGNVAVAVPPAIPAVPMAPKFSPLLVAFALGALLSLVLTYVVAFMDSTLHAPDDIRDVLSVPVIVAVSKGKAA